MFIVKNKLKQYTYTGKVVFRGLCNWLCWIEKAIAALEYCFWDAAAVLALPERFPRWLRPTNMLERFILEIRRREKVIQIFLNMESAYRLVGAFCAERHEEWFTERRYLDMDECFQWRANRLGADPFGEVSPPDRLLYLSKSKLQQNIDNVHIRYTPYTIRS
jgi:hypothetical protein